MTPPERFRGGALTEDGTRWPPRDESLLRRRAVRWALAAALTLAILAALLVALFWDGAARDSRRCRPEADLKTGLERMERDARLGRLEIIQHDLVAIEEALARIEQVLAQAQDVGEASP